MRLKCIGCGIDIFKKIGRGTKPIRCKACNKKHRLIYLREAQRKHREKNG